MTTFAKASFDAAGYLASRPTYPSRVYDIIYSYHALGGGRFEHALDLGCGPGFMALALSSRFTRVTALDPSSKMVTVGVQPVPPTPPITYGIGGAEDLTSAGLATSSTDLVVAGQAAHWFDHARAWPELARVVRPGGTVAYVGYSEMIFPAHPSLNALISAFQGGKDALGPHWSQPGRSIVEGLLDRVPFPVRALPDSSILSSLPDLDDDGGHPVAAEIDEPEPLVGDGEGGALWDGTSAVRLKNGESGKPWVLRKTWSLAGFEGYLRTSSALHTYHDAYPFDAARRGKGPVEGDIVDRLVGDVRAGLETEGVGGLDKDAVFEVGWPLVVMMIKRSGKVYNE